MKRQDIRVGLCQCGCGLATTLAPQTKRAQGYVKGVPVRFRPGHHRAHANGHSMSLKEYEVDPKTGCWNWLRSLSVDGYPKGRGSRRAHRVFYEEARGPIPPGLQLDHLCRNRRCVNPDHLEPVTSGENLRRGDRAKLTPTEVREIRALASTLSQRKIASLFGVTQTNVSCILRGKSWADIR